jgi:hypothetical protein
MRGLNPRLWRHTHSDSGYKHHALPTELIDHLVDGAISLNIHARYAIYCEDLGGDGQPVRVSDMALSLIAGINMTGYLSAQMEVGDANHQ